jgi:phasin family protein
MDPKTEEKPGRTAENAARRMSEETRRATRMASEAGAGAVRASVDVAERNARTMQDALESGTKIASNLAERSVAQMARAFGIGGDTAQQATEQLSHNMECILQSGTILADGMQNVSREWMEFAQKGMRHTLDRVEVLTQSRSPQEFLAAHSDLVRHNLEEFVHSTRRIAEISLRAAEEAARKVGESPQLSPR